MPNLKIHVDDALWSAKADTLTALLGPIRDLLCRELDVGTAACQLAIIPVRGLDDQPLVAVEILILPRPVRTREMVTAVGEMLRDMLASATAVPVAVRIAFLDPETYIALK